ncbi:nucleotidyltransferase family protein [Alphaproteobacteria bacterium]|nr:nucleotidyltransferase family protein [Alphaproteobacteria bacterium]MDC1023145.1 nucleotidyltransferase family protein [Alphaproteobacteria bacterium]
MIDKNSKYLIKKIVLAAGSSNRYGKENKLTQYINNKPVINHLMDKLLSVYDATELLIVTGYQDKTIINLINNPKIECVFNNDYKNGIGTSISTGVKELGENINGVMIIPADMPIISKNDLIKLENKFLEFNCSKVIFPKYKSQIGNPVLLPRNYFNTLISLKEDFGAKSQIKKTDIVTVKTDIGTVFDIDTISNLKTAKSIL